MPYKNQYIDSINIAIHIPFFYGDFIYFIHISSSSNSMKLCDNYTVLCLMAILPFIHMSYFTFPYSLHLHI